MVKQTASVRLFKLPVRQIISIWRSEVSGNR